MTDSIALARVIESSPIPTFVLNTDHRIIHYNRACEMLTGLRAADIIGTGQQWRAFYASQRPVLADLLIDGIPEAEIRNLYNDSLRPSALIRGAYESEGFFPALGKKGKWLFFTAAPLYNDRGEMTGAMETLQDITDRKEAEEALRESRRRHRSFLDFIPYPIVVSSFDGPVRYVNAAFTELFGWHLAEIRRRMNPFIPESLYGEAGENLEKLKKYGQSGRYITRRQTREGRQVHVAITAVMYTEFRNAPGGILEIMRDITEEMDNARRREAMLRISRVLPEYPDMEDLLDYISNEIKKLLESEGALVILLDEEKQELYFPGAAYDDAERKKRTKKIRFGLDELLAGEVIRKGEALIINDAQKSAGKYPERDKKFAYSTRNFLLVPLRSSERIIGVLAALNKKEGIFDSSHAELLDMLAGTVAVTIENARYADELKKAYRELSTLNRAKDRMLNHLSHELKTPLAVLSGSLNILKEKLASLADESWRRSADRAERNLERILQIQEEAEDIVENSAYQRENPGISVFSRRFGPVSDLIGLFLMEESGNPLLAENVCKKMDEFFHSRKNASEAISPEAFIFRRLESLKPLFAHRQVRILTETENSPDICLPKDCLEKIIDGLLRNALENTPDEGEIIIRTAPLNKGTCITVHDYGIGITPEVQKRIFDGFFSNRDISAYSSRRPFDFYAGGKGIGLLRMKIFSEKYHFRISLRSERCRHIPGEKDLCPGRISLCPFCKNTGDCLQSGQTEFSLYFPPAPSEA